MIEVFVSLPGEPPLLPGTPPGPRILTALPLDAFKLVHVGNPEWLFLMYGFHRSAERRIAAGANGLMHEAARDMIEALLPEVRSIYRTRGFTVDLSNEALNALAAEFAEEMMNSRTLAREASEFLKCARMIVVGEADWVAINPEVFAFNEHETIRSTINRWLDYVEHLKATNRYELAIRAHRFIVACSRLHDAVFRGIN